MKVKEIMQRDVISVGPDDNAMDALNFLFKKKISGLPVIDEKGKLLGMFTEKNVLSHILPSYVERVGKFIYEENPKAIKKKFSDLSTLKVGQLMRKEVVTAMEDTGLCEIAKSMLTQKARRVPVVDKEGIVVGIVARCDLLKALAGEAEVTLDT